MKLNINGRDVDLSKAFPLTIGDYRKLGSQGVEMLSGQAPSLDTMVNFVLYCLRKANAEITEQDVDALSEKEWIELVGMITRAKDETKLDRPTLTPCT